MPYPRNLVQINPFIVINVKKLRLLYITIAVLVVMNGILLSLFLMAPPHPHKRDVFRFIVDKVHFDAAQEDQYATMRDEHRAQMDALRGKMDAAKDRYFSGVLNGKEDTLTLNEIAFIQKEIESVTFHHFQQVRTLCRPEQLPQFDAIILEAIGMMGPPPPPKHH
jgi:hypothetical protein